RCKVDLNGDILEKVDGSSFAHGAINRKNGLVATADRGGGSNIWLYTIDGVLVRKLTHHKFNGDNRIMDIQWLNDKEILFTMSNYGLMNLHIETKKVATLIQGCNQNSYQFFSVSPDGREILIDRRDVKYICLCADRPTSIKYESKIYRYNVGSRRIYRVTEF
ncbi:MAG: hypothetical protein KDC76_08750, partial [Bacteroidetes bacterium]|nr:hypothetical protein [Bacteroidota bacterium]